MATRKELVREGIASFKKYVDTYDKQFKYDEYSDETIINDMLYGLGICINKEEYKFSDGFDKFKRRLIEHLTQDASK